MFFVLITNSEENGGGEEGVLIVNLLKTSHPLQTIQANSKTTTTTKRSRKTMIASFHINTEIQN